MKSLVKNSCVIIFPFIFCCLAQSQEHSHAKTNQQSDPDRERWYWQITNKVLTEIGIQIGRIVADIGSKRIISLKSINIKYLFCVFPVVIF